MIWAVPVLPISHEGVFQYLAASLILFFAILFLSLCLRFFFLCFTSFSSFCRAMCRLFELSKELNMNEIAQEIAWLQKTLPAEESPVEFCHNDIQSGNILVESSGVMHLLDYEACALSFF